MNSQVPMNLQPPMSVFALEPGATVECFTSKRVGIVVEIFERHSNGRIPVLVAAENGDLLPFADECVVVKPHIRRGPYRHEISADCAERWADYNRRGNARSK